MEVTMGTVRVTTWLVTGLLAAGSVPAEERGTPEEARALLDRAVALVESEGEKKALAVFNDPDGPFVDRDLYVFCMGPEYKITAHIDPGMRGMDVATLKDPDGKEFGREMIEIALKGGGSIEYRWVNPVTKDVEPKISFLKPAGNQFCGVGAYK
jgi:signal transduction histidine kinase